MIEKEDFFYALTWSISIGYGGMTGALLERSKIILEETKKVQRILTFDQNPDYEKIRSYLKKEKSMPEGIEVINLWEDMSKNASYYLEGLDGNYCKDKFIGWFESSDLDNTEGDKTRSDFNCLTLGGKENPVAWVIASYSGIPVVIDVKADIKGCLNKGIYIHDNNSGKVVRFAGRWDFYHWWLDNIIKGHFAHLVVDSKTVANFMCGYVRPNATTIHVVHGAHLGNKGELSDQRKYVFERLHKWDAIVFLTDQQRSEALNDAGNFFVIPNSVSSPRNDGNHERKLNEGLIVASLTNRKQVDHAIKAVKRASEILGKEIKLNICGEGDKKDQLASLVKEIKADNIISFLGYLPNAKIKFYECSFSLLTSKNEGLPLVLSESMSRGCIPISYDMKYGPASIIDNNVDGFVVPADDVESLARRVAFIASLSPKESETYRLKAKEKASYYYGNVIAKKWLALAKEVKDKKR